MIILLRFPFGVSGGAAGKAFIDLIKARCNTQLSMTQYLKDLRENLWLCIRTSIVPNFIMILI